MGQTLRPYQQEGRAKIFEAHRKGARRVLAVSPTGSGKTTIFSHITASLTKPVVILVHRRELAFQAANRLREFGVDFGYVMRGERPKTGARVQVCMVQTLVKRLKAGKRAPPAALVICDEAHLSTAETWRTILDCYPTAKIIGFTATPWRLGGKPLSGDYEACVVVATPDQLRRENHLCDYVGFSYKAPDLSKVKTSGGDYNQQQSGDAMREPTLVANIVEQWLAHASHLSTLVFAVTVDHSLELTAQFKAAGVRAEHLDGQTSVEQRKAILARMESGATQVLCNVGVAVEGLDIPRIKCIVLARPTKSLARQLQMVGRGRRPWQGQTLRIHDHAFNIKTHGLPDDDRDYDLTPQESAPPSMTQCQSCLAMYRGIACPACNEENEKKPTGPRELVTVDDAELFEFSSDIANPLAAEPPRKPVDVKWSNGKVVEGVFEAVEEETTDWGRRKRYLVRGARRHYSMPGTTVLDRAMAKIAIGTQIRVTQTHEQVFGDKRRKEFKVEIDDGGAAHV